MAAGNGLLGCQHVAGTALAVEPGEEVLLHVVGPHVYLADLQNEGQAVVALVQQFVGLALALAIDAVEDERQHGGEGSCAHEIPHPSGHFFRFLDALWIEPLGL